MQINQYEKFMIENPEKTIIILQKHFEGNLNFIDHISLFMMDISQKILVPILIILSLLFLVKHIIKKFKLNYEGITENQKTKRLVAVFIPFVICIYLSYITKNESIFEYINSIHKLYLFISGVIIGGFFFYWTNKSDNNTNDSVSIGLLIYSFVLFFSIYAILFSTNSIGVTTILFGFILGIMFPVLLKKD